MPKTRTSYTSQTANRIKSPKAGIQKGQKHKKTIYADLIKKLKDSDKVLFEYLFKETDLNKVEKDLKTSKKLSIFQKSELKAIIKAVASGDWRFHEAVRNRILGKPKEMLELTTPEPVEIIIKTVLFDKES